MITFYACLNMISFWVLLLVGHKRRNELWWNKWRSLIFKWRMVMSPNSWMCVFWHVFIVNRKDKTSFKYILYLTEIKRVLLQISSFHSVDWSFMWSRASDYSWCCIHSLIHKNSNPEIKSFILGLLLLWTKLEIQHQV